MPGKPKADQQEHDDEHDYRDGTGSLDDRVGKLEEGQQDIRGTLGEVLAILKGGKPDGDAAAPEEKAPEGGGGNIATEIQRQLAAQRQQDQAAQESQTLAERLGAVETSVRDMAEKAPGPLPRRVEKLMGWH